MTDIDPRFPKPIFWNDNSIKEFISYNHGKKICTLTWNSSDDIIFEQLRYAIDQDADIILSELLPHELPNETLLCEFNFFVDRYQYKAPYIITENEDKGNSQLLIISDSSEQIKNNRFYPIILRNFKNQYKSKSIDLNNKEDIENIVQYCAESSRFLINTQNVVLINFILSHCNKYDKLFTILQEDGFDYLRYILQGCVLSEAIKFHNQHSSLRSMVMKSLHFSKVSDYFAEYDDGANISIRKNDVKKVFQYSNYYSNNSNNYETRLSRYKASESFNYLSSRPDSSNYNQINANHTYGYILRFADETNNFYRRIKLFRDLAQNNIDKLEEIVRAFYEYPFKNNQYKKFPFIHEFLLSTLIASNDTIITENDRSKLREFGTTGFKNRIYKNRNCDEYKLFDYLENPLDNFDEFKEIIKQNILKPNSNFKSILQLLYIYPSFISDESKISLFEVENLRKNNRLLTNLFHGILYAYNLDIFDIYFKCFNKDYTTNYDKLNLFLSNPKVFSQIPTYLSNVLGFFLRNKSLINNKNLLTTNEKFSISRIYYHRKDFISVIDLLTTIEISKEDPVTLKNFLYFNELWTDLGLNEKTLNLSEIKFNNSYLSHSELSNLSHYIKSKKMLEYTSLCRNNESTNPYSFHHLLD